MSRVARRNQSPGHTNSQGRMQPRTIECLPNEILHQVQTYFVLPDLWALAATSRLWRALCQARLQRHLALRKRYRHLASNETEQLGWLTPLLAVLRHQVPAEYIEELSFSRCEYTYGALNANLEAKTAPAPTGADMALVLKAVQDSPWITQENACGPRANAGDMNEFIEEIQEGDQDNILAVLVPLLPNLRRINFTPNDRTDLQRNPEDTALAFGSLPQVLHRIAVASKGSAVAPACGQLREIRGSSSKSALYDDWLPYILAIPTLRRLEVALEYGWSQVTYCPPGTPKSNIQQLVLHGQACDRTLLEYLAKWVNGPCHVIHNATVDVFDEDTDAQSFAMRWKSCTLRDGKIEDVIYRDSPRVQPTASVGYGLALQARRLFRNPRPAVSLLDRWLSLNGIQATANREDMFLINPESAEGAGREEDDSDFVDDADDADDADEEDDGDVVLTDAWETASSSSASSRESVSDQHPQAAAQGQPGQQTLSAVREDQHPLSDVRHDRHSPQRGSSSRPEPS